MSDTQKTLTLEGVTWPHGARTMQGAIERQNGDRLVCVDYPKDLAEVEGDVFDVVITPAVCDAGYRAAPAKGSPHS